MKKKSKFKRNLKTTLVVTLLGVGVASKVGAAPQPFYAQGKTDVKALGDVVVSKVNKNEPAESISTCMEEWSNAVEKLNGILDSANYANKYKAYSREIREALNQCQGGSFIIDSNGTHAISEKTKALILSAQNKVIQLQSIMMHQPGKRELIQGILQDIRAAKQNLYASDEQTQAAAPTIQTDIIEGEMKNVAKEEASGTITQDGQKDSDVLTIVNTSNNDDGTINVTITQFNSSELEQLSDSTSENFTSEMGNDELFRNSMRYSGPGFDLLSFDIDPKRVVDLAAVVTGGSATSYYTYAAIPAVLSFIANWYFYPTAYNYKSQLQ